MQFAVAAGDVDDGGDDAGGEDDDGFEQYSSIAVVNRQNFYAPS